jgi:hypothetical protein
MVVVRAYRHSKCALFNCRLALLSLLLMLNGCAAIDRQSMPYDAWRLGFFAPDYMEVWIETADVVDVNNLVFRRSGSGSVGLRYPRAFNDGVSQVFKGNPKGWPNRHGWGAGKYVRGSDLPKEIYVFWQSMVEPQTYEAYIEIPESTREMMRNSVEVFCRADGKVITD